MLQHKRIDNLILLPRQAENIAVTRGFRQMMPPITAKVEAAVNSLAISPVRVVSSHHYRLDAVYDFAFAVA